MSFIETMLEWSRAALLPLGEMGLFLIAFTESSFSPIPVELLLIPLCLAKPELALWFAFIATFASVAGAVLGHYIGLKGGRPILRKFVSDHKVNRAEEYFNRAKKVKPKSATAPFNLGKLFAAQGQNEEAARELRQALKLNPELREARELLYHIESTRKGP